MGGPLDPADTLEPGEVTSLYLGALGLEDDDRRLAAAEAVLCLGRLGLRPGELLHLHEGWIDWEAGDLRIPERDPCACELCWERARVRQRDGDGRPLADIVAADCWDGTPRTVPFGWAGRLTGTLATATDAWPYLDATAEELRRLLAESAEPAAGVDPERVDFAALRSSAAAFLADAGFDAPRVADLLGVDVETAAAFTAQDPGRARSHLYRTFDAEPPAAAGQGEAYPLLVDPEPLENEPFDPREFDADWRADRAAAAGEPPETSPRPRFEPAEITSGGTDPAAEADTAGGRSAATEDDSSDDGPVTDLTELVTPPIALEVSTRFASSSLLEGRPSGGRVLFGQAEFVIAAHGGGEIQATQVVPYEAVHDVAVDWAPDRLEAIFDETIGVAVERDGERRTVVIEIPDGERESLGRTLFEGLLGEFRAVVRHPATVEAHVTDADPARRAVVAADGYLDVRGAEEPAPTVALGDAVGVERGSLTVDGEVRRGVRVDHLQPDGRTLGTFVAPREERDRRLLERFVRADHRHRERRATAADLSTEEREILEALEAGRGRRDLAKLLGMEREELSDLLDSLAAAGFVHAAGDGVRLTGLGRLHLGETVGA